MNCEKCGAVLEDGAKFCPSCGAAVEQAAEPFVTEQPTEQAAESYTTEQAPVEQSYMTEEPVQSTTYSEEVPPAGKGMAIGSMVCGILSIVLCCFTYISVILSIVAIVLGIISKKKTTEGSGMALAGIITGGVGLLITVVFIIIGAIAGAAVGSMSPDEITNYIDSL